MADKKLGGYSGYGGVVAENRRIAPTRRWSPVARHVRKDCRDAGRGLQAFPHEGHVVAEARHDAVDSRNGDEVFPHGRHLRCAAVKEKVGSGMRGEVPDDARRDAPAGGVGEVRKQEYAPAPRLTPA